MLRNILKGIGLLFAVGIIIASYFIYNIATQHKKMNQGELLNETVLDTIPFTYSSSGHILINVIIEGSETAYPFILDSGASNFIFNDHADEFDLDFNGWAIGLGANGNFFIPKIKKIDSLQIGNLKFKNINAEQTEFNFNCSDNIYGLIGIGVMKHLVWQIDFENKNILVSKTIEDLSFNENSIEIPLLKNKRSNHLRAILKFGKYRKTKSALVDLGSNSTLTLLEKSILKDSLQLKFKEINGKMSQGLGGENDSKIKEKYYLLDSLFFDKSTFSVANIPLSSSPNGLNLLGLSFFDKYRTTISWKDEKLILEPYDSIPNFIWNSAGFSTKFDYNLNRVIVNSVTENTAASEANVPLLSEIISINKHIFSDEASYCDYRYSKNKSDTLNLKVKDSIGAIKELVLIKKPIF